MGMDELLVDTGVFIDHLRAFRRLDAREERLAYSVVTRAELFSGREADRDGIELLLAPFSEHPLTARLRSGQGGFAGPPNSRCPTR